MNAVTTASAEDVSTVPAPTRRDARRRTRIAVAVYAVCLVALLAVASYLAPPGTVEHVPAEVGETGLQAR